MSVSGWLLPVFTDQVPFDPSKIASRPNCLDPNVCVGVVCVSVCGRVGADLQTTAGWVLSGV